MISSIPGTVQFTASLSRFHRMQLGNGYVLLQEMSQAREQTGEFYDRDLELMFCFLFVIKNRINC